MFFFIPFILYLRCYMNNNNNGFDNRFNDLFKENVDNHKMIISNINFNILKTLENINISNINKIKIIKNHIPLNRVNGINNINDIKIDDNKVKHNEIKYINKLKLLLLSKSNRKL